MNSQQNIRKSAEYQSISSEFNHKLSFWFILHQINFGTIFEKNFETFFENFK